MNNIGCFYSLPLLFNIYVLCRFENPFRNAVPTVNGLESEQVTAGALTRRDSDSTLPDSEHTDRPQSSSLQSSTLQSDEEESVTETGWWNEWLGSEAKY